MRRLLRGGRFVALGCLGSAVFGLAACDPPKPQALSLPKGFLMGTAIAGFQGDMGCPTESADTCEDRQSDWYQWVSDPEIGKSERLFMSGDPITYSSGQWELYAQDYKRLEEELSAKSYRLSVEWSRIFPQSTEGVEGYDALKKIANPKAIERYHAMFQELRKRKIRPFVTLNHYTLPLWMHDGVACHKDLDKCQKRGWLDRDKMLKELPKFAGFVAKEFGAEIDDWITLNEPLALVIPGYVQSTAARTNPPGVSLRLTEAKAVIFAMIEAHAKMYDAIKANDTQDADGDGKATFIGIAYNVVPFVPRDPKKKADVQGAENGYYLWNEAFLNAICEGKLDEKLNKTSVDRPDLKKIDFLGINYYGRANVPGLDVSLFPDFSPLLTFNALEAKQEVVEPKGLYDILLKLKKYNKPIAITENGFEMRTPDDEKKMASYLIRHLFWLQRASLEGVEIFGYHYWSFVDNFEWNHGMNLKFGLYSYDPKDQTKARKPRPGVALFRDIAASGQISKSLLREHLTAEEKALIPELLAEPSSSPY